MKKFQRKLSLLEVMDEPFEQKKKHQEQQQQQQSVVLQRYPAAGIQ